MRILETFYASELDVDEWSTSVTGTESPQQVMDVVEKKEKLLQIKNRIITFDMFEIKEYAFASVI